MTARPSLVAAAVVAALCASQPLAARAQAIPPAAGLWGSASNAHPLSAAGRRQLLSSIRRITGLNGVRFTSDGRLEAGEARRLHHGSRTAEGILRTALASNDVVVVEEHPGSDAVTFGQIEPMIYSNDTTKRQAQVWWVRLDFTDFQTIEAPRRVRAAFDPGFVFLHELLHAQGHRDGTRPGELGECERILNHVRAELDLPLRADYAAVRVTGPARDLTHARLRFHDTRRDGGTLQVQHLFFTAPPPPQATLRPVAAAAIRASS